MEYASSLDHYANIKRDPSLQDIPDLEGESADDRNRRICAALPKTDIGNGDRFVARYAKEFCFIRGKGWAWFNGTCWSTVNARERALECAKEVAQSIQSEHWRRASQALPRLKAMLECAETRLSRDLSDFDQDDAAIGIENGVLRITRSSDGVALTCSDMRAEDNITRTLRVAYDPEALCPIWIAHMERLHPDKEMRDFVQRLLGYCLLGTTRQQEMFIFHGRGGDGKSTTVNVLARIMGDYAQPLDVLALIATGLTRNADAASPTLARLAGDVRLAYTSEPPSKGRLNEGFIKLLTGGSAITARHNYQDPIEFQPRCKILLECNTLPKIEGTDDGIWRRIVVVPWDVQIPKHEMDFDLEAKLSEEASGILNWLLQGALAYLKRGLDQPPRVKEASAVYRKSSDSLGGWVQERLERNGTYTELQGALLADYRTYCAQRGLAAMRPKDFTAKLSQYGLVRSDRNHPTMRKPYWIGGRLPVSDAASAG